MGAMCGCTNSTNDIINFWKNIQLRNLSFDSYRKIFSENQRAWLSSGENRGTVDIRKCNELYPLLEISEFSAKQSSFYFDKLNEYINNQLDKLTFFTCLAFFTKVSVEHQNKKEKKDAENILDSFKQEENNANQTIHEKLFSHLIKMAIKKS
jgi:hypothetical protein